jgi:hypothetical protein
VTGVRGHFYRIRPVQDLVQPLLSLFEIRMVSRQFALRVGVGGGLVGEEKNLIIPVTLPRKQSVLPLVLHQPTATRQLPYLYGVRVAEFTNPLVMNIFRTFVFHNTPPTSRSSSFLYSLVFTFAIHKR